MSVGKNKKSAATPHRDDTSPAHHGKDMVRTYLIIFAVLIAAAIDGTGSPMPFFIGVAAFYLVNIAINWWFYLRRKAERPC